MKKKRNLGITLTALFMVIALALTGCGQKSEQNAGATGSGDGNGSVSEPNYEPEKADENAGDTILPVGSTTRSLHRMRMGIMSI